MNDQLWSAVGGELENITRLACRKIKWQRWVHVGCENVIEDNVLEGVAMIHNMVGLYQFQS